MHESTQCFLENSTLAFQFHMYYENELIAKQKVPREINFPLENRHEDRSLNAVPGPCAGTMADSGRTGAQRPVKMEQRVARWSAVNLKTIETTGSRAASAPRSRLSGRKVARRVPRRATTSSSPVIRFSLPLCAPLASIVTIARYDDKADGNAVTITAIGFSI